MRGTAAGPCPWGFCLSLCLPPQGSFLTTPELLPSYGLNGNKAFCKNNDDEQND